MDTPTLEAKMTLIETLKAEGITSGPRENDEMMQWLADGTQRFLSFRDDSVTLWQSHRPYAANERIDVLPLEQATAETIAAMVL